jgi:hypothetical protein
MTFIASLSLPGAALQVGETRVITREMGILLIGRRRLWVDGLGVYWIAGVMANAIHN